MLSDTRTTDSKARLVLPMSFANATVIVDQLSDTEIRVRHAGAIPEPEFCFVEQTIEALSDRDRDRFLEILAMPPVPVSDLKQAAERHKARRD